MFTRTSTLMQALDTVIDYQGMLFDQIKGDASPTVDIGELLARVTDSAVTYDRLVTTINRRHKAKVTALKALYGSRGALRSVSRAAMKFV